MSGSEEKGGRGCLKSGCLGCGAVGALVVLGLAIVAGVASMQVGNERVETPSIVRPETAAVPDAEPARGHVSLKVTTGQLLVRPAAAGEPLRVDARYDAESYRLDERLVEDGDGWRYELEFAQSGGGLMNLVRRMFGGTSPSVTVHLPRDVPIDLALDVFRAGGEVDLGGLWLRSASVETAQGGLLLEVSEPLREPMESFTVTARMGGLAIEDLGNASPRRIDATCSMGGLNLDLRGRWLVDSAIAIDVSRGDVNLELPRDVSVQGLGSHDRGDGLRPGADEVPRPTLRFETSTGQSGDISVGGAQIR